MNTKTFKFHASMSNLRTMRGHQLKIVVGVLILSIIIGLNATFGSSLVTYPIQNTASINYGSPLAAALHTDGRYIKDAQGNIIVLEGVNYSFYLDWVAGMWTGIGHNVYDDANVWSEANLRANLADMRDRWHINVVRVTISVARWVDNQSSGGVKHQQILMNLIRIAAEYGIYIVLAPWSAGAGQGELPWYPANNYIKNATDFANWWVAVSNRIKADAQTQGLQTYPNVIYDLWNEPAGGTETAWFNTCVQVFNALRANDDDHIILVQWGYNGPVTFIRDWLNQGRPIGNIVFTQHLYRHHGSFPGVNTTDLNALRTWISVNQNWGTAVNTWNVPVWAGETGAYFGFKNTADGNAEYACIVNEFKILKELQIGYAIWEWGREASYEWANFATDGPYMPPPNRVGQALIDSIAQP